MLFATGGFGRIFKVTSNAFANTGDGPAVLVQGFRFIADSRDNGFKDRLPQLDHPDGAWACKNHFECTKVCPRQIKITKRINQTKQRIKAHREVTGDPANDGTKHP